MKDLNQCESRLQKVNRKEHKGKRKDHKALVINALRLLL